MKRNKRVKKQSRIVASGTSGTIALVIVAFLLAMVYWGVDSQRAAIMQAIGKAEKQLAALESECVREAARWDEMRTPEKLSEKLVRFGLEMKYPRADQIVRMNADGRPAPGQLAVIRARSRATRTERIAQAAVLPDPARTSRRR